MAPPPGQSSSQPLPAREQALFKKTVKCYEHKQYKAGLKCAKQILGNSKYTEHGETLAMKGLILNCMGKHDEARENVKRGLKNDIKSHVCWHVFGLLQRSEKKYDEAIKAYRNALRIDKDNMQILRDLSLLQIQMRDLEGYRDTRYQLLTLRPTQRASWIGYATAYHLLEDYDTALKIVDNFIKTQQPSDYDFEYSELLLYQNMILRESGNLPVALEKLEENATHIHDRLAYMETRGKILMKMNKLDEAAKVYDQLLDRNSENVFYYLQLEKCRRLTLDEGTQAKRMDFYKKIQERRPKATAPKRIPLTFLKGAQFENALRPYLVTSLRKGVPSLFQNLRPLYLDEEKAAFIEESLLQFVRVFEEKGYASGSLDDSSDPETPTTVLWVYYFLAQHFDCLSNFVKAHLYIDRAIQHTPTLIELYVTKAKIYKHCGNPEEAVKCMEIAQQLDTADRYINSKCAKYLLRAGYVDQAEMTCGKFTREGANPSQSLNEMQCMWYETECAKTYKKLDKLGESLKKCHEVDRHFTGIIEDQFDFHTYCIRKMTLCAYIGLLRLEDVLRVHRFYYKAARIAVKIYLHLVDEPYDPSKLKSLDENLLSASEIRKLKRKEKKKQAIKDDQDKTRAATVQNNKKIDPELDGVPSEPLDSEQLLKTEKPLEEAAKFIEPLIQLNCREIGAYILGFSVYMRKGKILPMLQCVKSAGEIDPEHPKLHVCKVQFLHYYSKNSYEGPVAEILSETIPLIFPNSINADELVGDFKEKHQNSFPHRLAVAESTVFLDTSASDSMKQWLIKSLENDKLQGRTWKVAKRMLRKWSERAYGKVGTDEEFDQIVDRCMKIFKDATVLKLFLRNGNGSDTEDVTKNGHKTHMKSEE